VLVLPAIPPLKPFWEAHIKTWPQLLSVPSLKWSAWSYSAWLIKLIILITFCQLFYLFYSADK
jgi:hypothetical protein